jgi:hypothetical protein
MTQAQITLRRQPQLPRLVKVQKNPRRLLAFGGATIDQLAAAMGWLPHTTRAALTGQRKGGFGIERREEKGERAGAYVIVDGPNAAQG